MGGDVSLLREPFGFETDVPTRGLWAIGSCLLVAPVRGLRVPHSSPLLGGRVPKRGVRVDTQEHCKINRFLFS